MGLNLFCEECGAVLDKGNCTNRNCSLSPKYVSLPSKLQKRPARAIEIPKKKETALRCVCFSDWSTQSLELILEFVQNLQPAPDVILYAGDDTKRFVKFKDRTINLTELDSPDQVSSSIERNYFAELASHSKHGLFAVIGNDCHPSHKLFIHGDKVRDIGEGTVELGNFVICGLEGAESITSTWQERTIEPNNNENREEGHDLGPTIFPRERYYEKLEVPSEYRDKLKIIVSHSPPYECLDLAQRFGQAFIGSIALHQSILEDPMIKLVACGHVHQYGGKHRILNGALVVNCASHDDEGAIGNVAVVDLDRRTGDVLDISWNHLRQPLAQKIWGIGHVRATVFEDAGYFYPEDLIAEPDHVIYYKIDEQIPLATITELKARAESVVKKQIISLKQVKVSSDELEKGMIIDIETDLKRKEIWCIGTLFRGKCRHFFLDNPSDGTRRKALLIDFQGFLKRTVKKHGKITLYCYSTTDFDFQVIEDQLKRYGCRVKQFRALNKIDLGTLLVNSTCLPIPYMKLKAVAAYFDYNRSTSEDYDGLMACHDYYRAFRETSRVVREKKKDLKRGLLTYNREDLLMVMHIWKRLFP